MVFVDGKKNMHCFCGFCQERRTCIAFLNTSTPSSSQYVLTLLVLLKVVQIEIGRVKSIKYSRVEISDTKDVEH